MWQLLLSIAQPEVSGPERRIREQIVGHWYLFSYFGVCIIVIAFLPPWHLFMPCFRFGCH